MSLGETTNVVEENKYQDLLFKVLPHGRLGKLHILIYHRVMAEFDPLRPDEITKAQFEQHLSLFKQYFNVLSLPEAYQRLKEGTLPANALCITFDDGYKDNVEVALPLLKTYDMPASFFIATGFLNDSLMFNDVITETVRQINDILVVHSRAYTCSTTEGKRQAIHALIQYIKPLTKAQRIEALKRFLPEVALPNLMMGLDGLQKLDMEGMHIGAHTINHPLLSQVTAEEAFKEIETSKLSLEEILQKPIRWFAYPNGKYGQDFNDTHVKQLKKLNFSGALTTDKGVATRDSHRFMLPRFTPWQREQKRFLFNMFFARI